ncbi:hypothetical protein [Paenibacillus sp. FSL L8-0709]|uniref:hypothetical protein n=1 Tax=Paenibacillus sp. FSL L8-0709 TaxID=2975312 RepID=UPI0030F605A2
MEKLFELKKMNVNVSECFVQTQMAVALSLLIDDRDNTKIRLYTPANNKLSWKKGRLSLPWYSSFDGAKWRARGSAIVAVDIPKSLLIGAEVNYFEKGRFNAYTLKQSALRYAKRSFRLASM